MKAPNGKNNFDSVVNEIGSIRSDPHKIKLNLGCGLDIRPPEQGWINVDGISAEHVWKMDIFKLPWEMASESLDYILAKHLLEHVPHNNHDLGYDVNFMQLFMEEVWRVLKVNGILDIEVPGDISSLIHAIDHKRIVSPETFHIFYPEDSWNYYTSCRFELCGYSRNEPLRFKIFKYLAAKVFCIDITYLRPHILRFILRRLPDARQL